MKRKNDKLTEMQIIQMLISPRAALDRLLALGRIDFDDIGALQCVYVLAAQVETIANVDAPDSSEFQSFVRCLENGATDDDSIYWAHEWLDSYAEFLRTLKLSDFRKALEKTNKQVAQSA